MIALAGWIVFAEEPFAGLGSPLALAAGALAAYAVWTLLSATWSDSTARALLEFNRALLYLAALAAVRACDPRGDSFSGCSGVWRRGSSSSARSL